MSGFQTPIKIKEAIDAIVARQYLLPAIQRKFVWSASKVEALFDSIMQGYPINSFMFWKITSPDVKNRVTGVPRHVTWFMYPKYAELGRALNQSVAEVA